MKTTTAQMKFKLTILKVIGATVESIVLQFATKEEAREAAAMYAHYASMIEPVTE